MEDRLKSFTLPPPWEGPVDAHSMSEAGFVYTGQEDLVYCFNCNIKLDGWTKHMDPLLRHKEESPTCSFVRQQLQAIKGEKGKVKSVVAPSKPLSPRQTASIGQLQSSTLFSSKPIHTVVTGLDEPRSSRGGDDFLLTSLPISLENYGLEADRIRSFVGWPLNESVHPEQLARVGFVYTGEGSLVQCFQCGVRYRNWLKGDIPLSVHQRCNPRCAFLQTLSSKTISSLDKANRSHVPDFSIDAQNEIITLEFPDYSDQATRLQSFKYWGGVLPKEELAEAGFYMIARRDVVRCFSCHVVLQDWERTDNVIDEHRRHSPNCPVNTHLSNVLFSHASSLGKMSREDLMENTFKMQSRDYQRANTTLKSLLSLDVRLSPCAKDSETASLPWSDDNDGKGIHHWTLNPLPCDAKTYHCEVKDNYSMFIIDTAPNIMKIEFDELEQEENNDVSVGQRNEEDFISPHHEEFGSSSSQQTGSHSPPNLKVSDNPLELASSENQLSERHDFEYISGFVPSSYPSLPETSSSSYPLPMVSETISSSGSLGPEASSIHSMNNQLRPFTEILQPLSSFADLCRLTDEYLENNSAKSSVASGTSSSHSYELPLASLVDIQNFEVNETGCAAVVGVPLGTLQGDDSVTHSTSMEKSQTFDEADLLQSVHVSIHSNTSREHTENRTASMKSRDCQSLPLGSESLSSLDIRQPPCISKSSRVCSVDNSIEMENRNYHNSLIDTTHSCLSTLDLRIPPSAKSDVPQSEARPIPGMRYPPSWVSNPPTLSPSVLGSDFEENVLLLDYLPLQSIDTMSNAKQIVYEESLSQRLEENNISMRASGGEDEDEPATPGAAGLCQICYNEKIQCIFLPCGHARTCWKCATNLKNSEEPCPYCQKSVLSNHRIYL